MRVLIGAFGTRGDVQPMVALAQALTARGHAVTMGVPPNLRGWVRGHGFEVFSAGVDYEELSRRSPHGSLKEVITELSRARGEVRAQLEAMEAHAEHADVLVGSSVFTIGTLLSDKLNKPYVFFAFVPQLFKSAEHPSILVPWQTLPRWLNRLTGFFDAGFFQLVLGRPLDEVRAERGLGPAGNVWRALVGRHPVAAFDPALALAPADYPVPITQVGALFVQEQDELSPELEAFLKAGPPPVYVGFGSMGDPDPRQTARRVLESIRRAGARALVSRGWAGLSVESPPEDVLFIGAEPHQKLFPRCAAVVHHGGAGTTHAAARAGVPQVVMPQLLDQHYWAYRVWRTGIGPKRVPRHARDPEPLAQALRTCLEDAALRARVREVSGAMRTDGAQTAAALVERAVSG